MNEIGLMVVYLSFITTFSVACFIYSFKKDFAEPKNRKLRGGLYLTLGISAGVPVIHLAFFSSTIGGLENYISYFWWMFGGISYIAGAVIYIMRFPERWCKGWFDNFVRLDYLLYLYIIIGK